MEDARMFRGLVVVQRMRRAKCYTSALSAIGVNEVTVSIYDRREKAISGYSHAIVELFDARYAGFQGAHVIRDDSPGMRVLDALSKSHPHCRVVAVVYDSTLNVRYAQFRFPDVEFVTMHHGECVDERIKRIARGFRHIEARERRAIAMLEEVSSVAADLVGSDDQ